MPPPHLHPRSRMTSSLFATTLFASFFVVVLPHVLPCPAPGVTLSDGQMVGPDGTPIHRRRRRRRPQDGVTCPEGVHTGPVAAEVERGENGMARFASMEESAAATTTASQSSRRAARECPVPKPGVIVSELMGFKRSRSSEAASPPEAPHQSISTPFPKQP